MNADVTGTFVFLSTPSARRATSAARSELPRVLYFYPRPPRGGRPDPSAGRWRRVHNFYPRPPRGGRRQVDRRQPGRLQISIHALREEGDAAHAVRLIAAGLFLSTPSARRATNRLEYEVVGHGFLSTPSARRATIPAITSASSSGISIHALREEGDCYSSVEGR